MTTAHDTKPKTAAIIVAAGRGTRAGGDISKQWQYVAGRPIAAWTLDRFRVCGHVSTIILVLHQDDIMRDIEGISFDGITRILGGETRNASVLCGLKEAQKQGFDQVLIHDVARPCVSDTVIDGVITALNTAKGAAPGLQVTDALWTHDRGQVSGTQDRSTLMRAQTPQGFHLAPLLEAHLAHKGDAADDVEIARAANIPVQIVPGSEDNIKVTTPEDFARAARILKGQAAMDIRVGNGYDVHRFGDGDHVILCGVKVPFNRSLQGHSDADVGMHAVTDAIYGALADGDIGQHFPPSEAQWKGAASDIFLRHAVSRATERGYTISNVDCTLVCEFPKIGPVAIQMREKMAEIMGLDVERVSLKATTSEKLGFTGRGEGIAALATATLIKP